MFMLVVVMYMHVYKLQDKITFWLSFFNVR